MKKLINVHGLINIYGKIDREILQGTLASKEVFEGKAEGFYFNKKEYDTTIGDMDKIVYDVEKYLEKSSW